MLIITSNETFRKKRNESFVWSRCTNCGRFGKLGSFDAAFGSALYGISALMGAGKEVHVIDHCKRCTGHAQIPQFEWNEIINTELEPALQACLADPDDRDKVETAISASMQFRDKERFEQVAEVINQLYLDDAELQLQLGVGYTTFMMPIEAETALKIAHELDPNNENLTALTFNRIGFGYPDEAYDDVWYLIDQGVPGRSELGVLLAQSLQAKGRHQEALTVLERLEHTLPGIENEPRFKMTRILSKPLRNSNRPAGGRDLPNQPDPRRRTTKKDILIAAMCVALAFTAYAIYCGVAPQGPTYVVGGREHPYQVTINGNPVTIPALGEHTKVVLDYGPVTVTPVNPDDGIPTQSFEYDVPYLARAFTKRTLVINPDRNAVIVCIDAEYATNPDPPDVNFHAGQPFYTFDNVDYHFRDLPDTITTESHSETKRGIKVWWDGDEGEDEDNPASQNDKDTGG